MRLSREIQRGQGPGPAVDDRRRSALAFGVVVVIGLVGAGCSGGTAGSSARIVSQPHLQLQGCTYEVNSTIPAGVPQGVQPGFPAFEPDPSAAGALEHIRDHGGTAMVDSVTVPSGVDLFAGPDAGGSPVGTVPGADNLLVAEPVVYTDHAGGTWLAFFLACGGANLYWVGLDQARRQHAAFVSQVATQIEQLRAAPSYTLSHQASLLPIAVDQHRNLVFVDPSVAFVVGRGELFSSV